MFRRSVSKLDTYKINKNIRRFLTFIHISREGMYSFTGNIIVFSENMQKT